MSGIFDSGKGSTITWSIHQATEHQAPKHQAPKHQAPNHHAMKVDCLGAPVQYHAGNTRYATFFHGETMEPAADAPVTTRYVDANGIRFEVNVCGQGDRLALCLHGFPEHAFSWRYQLPMLAQLGFTAWAPNLRGYGNTTKPAGIAAYSLETLMADVAGLIDASGCREVVLIAHDWGAVIAWLFAVREVRPLQQLIICNVPHPGAAAAVFRGWQQLKKSWYIWFFQIPGLPEWILGRHDAWRVGAMIRRSSCDPSRFADAIIAVYSRNAAQPGALTAMINYYRALVRGGGATRQYRLGFPLIETPTLMLWGEEDVALSKETTYGTGRFVRDLTIRYLPGVSHWVQQEQPEIVNAMIKAFLLDERVPEMVWHAQLEGSAHAQRS